MGKSLRRIGDYELLDRLGKGAMGEVWLARHRESGREVVVKRMHQHLSPDNAERFRLEAQALARVAGEFVVAVLDWGVAPDRRPYLVLERLSGQPLQQLLERAAPLPVERAIEIAYQIACALCRLHQAGLVHRDVKPSNIWIEPDGAAKLLDFGIAKLLRDVTGVEPLRAATRAGSVVGTPKYMAPEQGRGKPVDGRADQYALAMVLYVMLTGEHPYARHTTLAEMIKAHIHEPVPAPSERAPHPISAAVDRLVLQALSKDADDRFPNSFAFVGRLAALRPESRRQLEALGLTGEEIDSLSHAESGSDALGAGGRPGWVGAETPTVMGETPLSATKPFPSGLIEKPVASEAPATVPAVAPAAVPTAPSRLSSSAAGLEAGSPKRRFVLGMTGGAIVGVVLDLLLRWGAGG